MYFCLKGWNIFQTTFPVRLDIAVVNTSGKCNSEGDDVWKIPRTISYETTVKMGT